MQRDDLVPRSHRAERLFLLDLLGSEPTDGDAAASIDAEAFLEVAPKTLYPYLHARLRPVAHRLPSTLTTLLAQHHRQNALTDMRRIADLRGIGAALDAAGIAYLVLKGPILAATVYPEPGTRTMLDVDLLVHDVDMPRAIAALEALGYFVPPRFAGAAMNAGDAPPMINGQPGSPVIELHSLLDSVLDDDAALDAAWRNHRLVGLGNGFAVPALDRGEFFAHVVTHVSRHHRFEDELRSLLDVALLLRSPETEFDWEALTIEWQRRRIDGWIALTLSLASILLGAPMPRTFANMKPARETLMLAAEQLWAKKAQNVAGVTSLVTGAQPSPTHPHEDALPVVIPAGVAGVRLRASRQWQRALRLFSAFRDGRLRPRNIAENVDLFRKRERLFAILESDANSARRERPTR
ncbi:MAG TPA: nucleotidyltransferase family protein [Thermoanaerobaculia bacterium]|jgi:hypothetical protein|nr:nucleotidyltransferase family protein [Thermoanaerobaculia bacterium]